ncbi:MAG: DUF4244 domain-containing protein [Actinophytocola sp.]|uniref:DUF4244 domain-containing protein n=1 Tax=Actinophytocola sp. TaxID=1872138 RepID=UPI0013213CF5|nr:DUF4244 domain-containing protein [Actinophytocola sp.]MPZ82057.1 DUF4244 domain-containing protein [Actinophytocola sp.]
MFPHRTPLPLHPRRDFLLGDDGMSTVEYCVGLVAAAAFAMVLYAIVSGADVLAAVTSIVQRALTVDI